MNLNCQGSVFSRDRQEDIGTVFWSLWQQNQNDIYRCCLKWMNNNPTDAEDALSRAMLKAWEKAQKYAAGEITNFKAWLTRLTRNLCIDIHRSRDRAAKRVENIEAIASVEEIELVSVHDTPLGALEKDEKKMVIRRAIDNLSPKMRETFMLHFYQELSYQEIAQQQDISYQNVCKRISQARAILRLELKGYWIGDDSTDGEESPKGEESKKRVESPKGKKSQKTVESPKGEESTKTVRVEPIAIETVILSEKIQEVAIVAGAEPQEPALSEPQIESAIISAQSDGQLEVKQNACRRFKATLCVWQLTQVLIKTQ
ncbi:sigma-70 family RNA polymerase sigma factor [Microcoleus sp. D3_18a_C4]|uniref:sigma-70 family RNA polymerase sigma factor n=1 Tax=unclassified Microcoleus TaxID=2642155 RepID=UPI002FD3DFB4